MNTIDKIQYIVVNISTPLTSTTKESSQATVSVLEKRLKELNSYIIKIDEIDEAKESIVGQIFPEANENSPIQPIIEGQDYSRSQRSYSFYTRAWIFSV